MSAFVAVARKSFNEKFTVKIDFLHLNFFCASYVRPTISDAQIESLRSLHTLFDKYLDRVFLVKFEQNRMEGNITYKLLSFLRKKKG